MPSLLTGKMAKWGNSQGVRIPREVCSELGVEVGTAYTLTADPAHLSVTIAFEPDGQVFHRNRRVSLEELCGDWHGGKVGEEWGGRDVGAEVVK